jgi:hypothetical protein
VHSTAFLFVLAFSLTLYHQAVPGDFDLDVLFVQARQLGAYNEIAIMLAHINGGSPGCQFAASEFPIIPRAREHAVHVLAKSAHHREWIGKEFIFGTAPQAGKPAPEQTTLISLKAAPSFIGPPFEIYFSHGFSPNF